MNGEHWVCVNIDVTDYAIPDNTRMVRVHIYQFCTNQHEFDGLL
jgi:hypothetical protein